MKGKINVSYEITTDNIANFIRGFTANYRTKEHFNKYVGNLSTKDDASRVFDLNQFNDGYTGIYQLQDSKDSKDFNSLDQDKFYFEWQGKSLFCVFFDQESKEMKGCYLEESECKEINKTTTAEDLEVNFPALIEKIKKKLPECNPKYQRNGLKVIEQSGYPLLPVDFQVIVGYFRRLCIDIYVSASQDGGLHKEIYEVLKTHVKDIEKISVQNKILKVLISSFLMGLPFQKIENILNIQRYFSLSQIFQTFLQIFNQQITSADYDLDLPRIEQIFIEFRSDKVVNHTTYMEFLKNLPAYLESQGDNVAIKLVGDLKKEEQFKDLKEINGISSMLEGIKKSMPTIFDRFSGDHQKINQKEESKEESKLVVQPIDPCVKAANGVFEKFYINYMGAAKLLPNKKIGVERVDKLSQIFFRNIHQNGTPFKNDEILNYQAGVMATFLKYGTLGKRTDSAIFFGTASGHDASSARAYLLKELGLGISMHYAMNSLSEEQLFDKIKQRLQVLALITPLRKFLEKNPTEKLLDEEINDLCTKHGGIIDTLKKNSSTTDRALWIKEQFYYECANSGKTEPKKLKNIFFPEEKKSEMKMPEKFEKIQLLSIYSHALQKVNPEELKSQAFQQLARQLNNAWKQKENSAKSIQKILTEFCSKETPPQRSCFSFFSRDRHVNLQEFKKEIKTYMVDSGSSNLRPSVR